MIHKILFIDDEINVLKGIKRLFSGTDYNIFIESDCGKALDILKNNKISVLVSDMRMPDMNGIALIKLANVIDPVCIKIILSGYSEIDDIMTAINEGHIYSYITKPWHDAGLKLTISHACGLYENKIKEKLLMRKLREKHNELLEMNKTLEPRVMERTREINATNIILNKIVAGAPHSEILSLIAYNISVISDNAVAALYSVEDQKCYFCSQDREGYFNQVLDKIKKSADINIAEKYFSLPILNGHDLLGTLIVQRKEGFDINDMIKHYSTFISSARLYLSQKKLVSDSAELIGSIDSIIGEIGDE
ncbi:MAG TPA: response regulator [Actinobacteria bacterium]|nr:response regulator [Actinomycetota bacterium]